MSKKSLRKINMIYKTGMLAAAASLAVGALIYNRAHLFTVMIWVAYTLNSGFVEKKNGGISYE